MIKHLTLTSRILETLELSTLAIRIGKEALCRAAVDNGVPKTLLVALRAADSRVLINIINKKRYRDIWVDHSHHTRRGLAP